MTPNTPTRRTLLTTSTAALTTTALTGCLNLTNDTTTTTTATQDQDSRTFNEESPLEKIDTTATELVVDLENNHDVSQLNLLNPDGSVFGNQQITTGQSTVRYQLIDAYDGVIGEENYSPGNYTVISKSEEDTYRAQIALEPNIELRNVEPQFDEETGEPTGNLELKLENTGTGPTWIFQIAYSGAPYEEANTSLHGNRTWPDLESPGVDAETVIAPGKSKTYIGKFPPLRFPDNGGISCSSNALTFELAIGSGIGGPTRYEMTATPSGESVSLRNHHVCTDVTLEFERLREETWA